LIRDVLTRLYSATPDGYCGDEDNGQTSAWYVFSSLGFYPIAGTDIYQLGAPLFRDIEVDLDGEILRIEAENYAPGNLYVNKVRLNDTILNRTWIRHSEIAGGGVLSFVMSDAPGTFR